MIIKISIKNLKGISIVMNYLFFTLKIQETFCIYIFFFQFVFDVTPDEDECLFALTQKTGRGAGYEKLTIGYTIIKVNSCSVNMKKA